MLKGAAFYRILLKFVLFLQNKPSFIGFFLEIRPRFILRYFLNCLFCLKLQFLSSLLKLPIFIAEIFLRQVIIDPFPYANRSLVVNRIKICHLVIKEGITKRCFVWDEGERNKFGNFVKRMHNDCEIFGIRHKKFGIWRPCCCNYLLLMFASQLLEKSKSFVRFGQRRGQVDKYLQISDHSQKSLIWRKGTTLNSTLKVKTIDESFI